MIDPLQPSAFIWSFVSGIIALIVLVVFIVMAINVGRIREELRSIRLLLERDSPATGAKKSVGGIVVEE